MRAPLLMLLSVVLFAGMAIAIRLASKDLHAFEIAFFRNFFGLLFALPLLYKGGTSLLRTDRLGLYFFRCFIGLCGMLCGFWAIAHLPMSQAIALSYTTPLFVTIGAVLTLGEVIRARRISALAVGFIGTLIILQIWTFGASWLSSGVWIGLLSSLLTAGALVSIKFLSRTEPSDAIVFYMVLIMTPMSALPAYWVWQTPQGLTWLWLLLTGFFGTTAQMAMTRAYKLGDVSALTPINFVQLPLIALAAWWLFDETPNRYTWIGAGIVFASTAYIAHRESVLARIARSENKN
jgi:drug/metabolite transporter (DMT)-like permease